MTSKNDDAVSRLQESMLNDITDADIPDLLEAQKGKNFPKFNWDKIDEELKHPLFMHIKDKNDNNENRIVTQEEIDSNVDLQAMQALLYSGDTPYEKAEELKNDGNAHFKKKLYKLAKKAYSAGMSCQPTEYPADFLDEEYKTKPNPTRLRSILANNRASCEFYLKNYRSAIKDSMIAIREDKTFIKPYNRAIQCFSKLEYYNDAIEQCKLAIENVTSSELEKMVKFDHNAKKLKDGVENSVKSNLIATMVEYKKKLQLQERDRRKKINDKKRYMQEISKVAAKIEAKYYQCTWSKEHVNNLLQNIDENYRFDSDKVSKWLLSLLSSATQFKITVLPENFITLPIVFFYPEYKTTDVISHADERTILGDLIATMFEERPGWDINHDYDYQYIECYFEDKEVGRYTKLDHELTIDQVARLAGLIDGSMGLSFISNHGKSKKVRDEFIKQKL